MQVDDKPKKMGFYKTVFVDSSDQDAAKLDAVEFIRSNGELIERTLNSADDPPMIFVEEMYELESSAVDENTTGHTFYVEKKWWQFWK